MPWKLRCEPLERPTRPLTQLENGKVDPLVVVHDHLSGVGGSRPGRWDRVGIPGLERRLANKQQLRASNPTHSLTDADANGKAVVLRVQRRCVETIDSDVGAGAQEPTIQINYPAATNESIIIGCKESIIIGCKALPHTDCHHAALPVRYR
jgi:hypothetical protein